MNTHHSTASLFIFTFLASLNIVFTSPAKQLSTRVFKYEKESHFGDLRASFGNCITQKSLQSAGVVTEPMKA